LKEQDIHAIFELRKRGWLQREIAECLAISPSHANMILCGHKWQHLKDDYAT
jgi:transcriptional regulator